MAYLNRIPDLELAKAINAQSYQGKEIKRFSIIGRRLSFTGTTAYEDLADWLTTPSFPLVAGTETWEVVSASANDTAAGTGARSVQIHYLDSAWLPQATNVTLNGLTPVAVPAMANCKAVQWMHSLTVGSGGVAAGNITLRTVSGAVTHERIQAGGNQSLSCRYTVPEGYFAFVTHWNTGMGTSHNAQVVLRATVTRYDGTLTPGVFLSQDAVFLNANNATEVGSTFTYPAQSQIKISTITANVGADIIGSMHIELFKL